MNECYLGIDIGSISTKGVVIDNNYNIITSLYIWTNGNPIGAVRNLVNELKKYGANINNAKGVPEEMLRKASSMSVCKINIDSDLRLSVTLAIRKFMAENKDKFDPRGYLGCARDAVCNLVKSKILNVLGSASKSSFN